jgi:hypothetical protein
VVAVVPQTVSAAQQYLQRLGIAVDEVKQAPLESIRVEGTPTLLLIDGSGVVTGEWVGKLSGEKEAEVIKRIQADQGRG